MSIRPLVVQPLAALAVFLCSLPAFGQFIPNRYTVILEDPPVSSRFATMETMRSGPAVAYRQQVEAKQAALVRQIQARNIHVTGSESTLLNAIFVTVTPDRLVELRGMAGVLGVRPMRRFKPTMNKAVQLMNAPAAWNVLGGQANAGKGMKIAILDSGIDQTHAAFQDSSLTPPAGFPKCTNGHPEDCAYTNNKVIVARSYIRDLANAYVTDPNNPAPLSVPDDYSPRDRFGHGTATASAAAGNTNSGTVTFSGMAPKAFLGNYKISGSPAVNDGTDDQVMIEALSDAVADGMDVVSLSYGSIALTGPLDTGSICGNPAGVACDPVAAAYEAAAKGGMIIAVAAGNSGTDSFNNGGQYPYFDSISSPATAPSVIAVGASTNSHVMTPSVSVNTAGTASSLKGIAAELSDASFAPSQLGSNVGPLVDVTTLGNDGLACTALPAFSLVNQYALIERGTCDFATKASNAQLAGAIGVVFYMADSSSLISPSGLTFNGPAVMISNSDGVALKKYIDANPGQSVTIDLAGIETDLNTYSTVNGLSPAGPNQFAGYSSMGPTPDGSIKPDLLAVGGFDPTLAFPLSSGLYLAAQTYDPTLNSSLETLYSTNGYIAADGTSFATPILAGAAALVKQAHPTYTAAQVKSALVNAAAQTITTDDIGEPVDVEWLGAGLLDAGAAINATVTAEPSTISLGFVKAGVLPVTRTITITNKGTASVTLASAVKPNSTVTGITVGVDKSSVTLAAGANTTITVTLSGTVPTPGSYSGAVTLTATGVSLRLPYMFIVGDGVAYNANPVFPFAFGIPGTDGGTLAVQVIDQFGAPVVGSPVSFSLSPRGSLTFESVTGEPACSPATSTVSVTCNTDNYGIAYVEALLGSNISSPTITARAAGTTFDLGAFILAQPQIKATGGVVNAANFQSPISPGSYITIFGSNLVDTTSLVNAAGDSETTSILPLSLDFVNVSFDVPSAGISVPGHLTFVSSGQINLQVPWELQGQTSAQVKVIVDLGLFGNVITVPVADYSPAFFLGNGIVAAINATQGNIVTASTPAHAGDVLELFGNGFGPVNNPPASGSPAPSNPLSTTKTNPAVTVGGQNAIVSFSGLAPGFPGLYQVNITVPSVAAGSQPVTLTIGGQSTSAANIPVK